MYTELNCKCGFPIPPQLICMKEGFFSYKEVANISNWKCPICGRNYKLKSYNGNIEILE